MLVFVSHFFCELKFLPLNACNYLLFRPHFLHSVSRNNQDVSKPSFLLFLQRVFLLSECLHIHVDGQPQKEMLEASKELFVRLQININ